MPLHLVPTPIGDPDDISLRALRVLREADLVAAEDTRSAAALLAHHGLRASLRAFHDHNEDELSAELVERIAAGASVALVSEAGMPLLSDPGWPLLKACLARGLPVVVLPGPNAALTALVGSGLPVHRFFFGGFLPRTAGELARLFDELAGLDATLIFHESPLRLAASLEALAARWPSRQVVVARNLTKRWEQWLRGTATSVREALGDEVRGEVVLLVGPPEAREQVDPDRLIDAMLARGDDLRSIRDAVAEATGLPRREVYQRVLLRRGERGGT